MILSACLSLSPAGLRALRPPLRKWHRTILPRADGASSSEHLRWHQDLPGAASQAGVRAGAARAAVAVGDTSLYCC